MVGPMGVGGGSIAASRVPLRPLVPEITGGGGKYYPPPAMRVRLATPAGRGLMHDA